MSVFRQARMSLNLSALQIAEARGAGRAGTGGGLGARRLEVGGCAAGDA